MESDHEEPQLNLDDQGDLLESLKQEAIQSVLYFFKNDSGCSLGNTTTNIHSIFLGLPSLGNKNGRKLDVIVIIMARNSMELD